jgi:hypothetical protein
LNGVIKHEEQVLKQMILPTKGVKKSFEEDLAIIQKHNGFVIDQKTTSVKMFFTYVKMLEKETKKYAMPQKIENKDIFSPDFLEPQKKSFKEIIELIKLMESEMKDVLKVQQQLVKTSDKKSVEGLKKRQRAVQSVNQVSKEMLKLEKQRKSASSQLAIAETQEAKAVAATRIELARKKKAVKKAVKEEILAEKGLVSEYQKQSARLNDLRKKYKDLILVQGKETRATRKLKKEITSLDTKLKKVDASVGQFQRSVGNYGKAFGKVTGVLRNFGLAVGGLAVIRNITGK